MLGAARITAEALIVPAQNVQSVELHGIAARNPARARAFAGGHSIARTYDNYESLIRSPEIDLVYNALPVSLHAKWTIDALTEGKHVLCEKPFAMNIDEAEAMVAAATQSGARVIEAFHYRYHPAFQTLLRWIANGAIGNVRSIHAYFNVAILDDGKEIRHRPELGGGAMMDLGCYPLFLFRYFGGTPPEASYFLMLLREGPVSPAISLIDSRSRSCQR